MMDHQRAILELAKKRGIDMARVTPEQYRSLAVEVRSWTELVRDGAVALASRLNTSMSLKVVSPAIAAENEAKCRSGECGRFRSLRSGPACDACNCHNKWLKSKWKDANEHCPLPQPLWDNRTVKETSSA